MSSTPKLLIWSENYWIGGCDRFLADLIAGLDPSSVAIVLAGNPHPEFDSWLRARVPRVLPRTVIPVANLVRTPLHRLDHLRSGGGATPLVGETADGIDPAAGDGTAVRAGIAALRYAQAGVNLVRLTRLMMRVRPETLLINNGGYPGAESCRVAALAARRAGVPRVVHFVHNMAAPPAWPTGLERALDRRVDGAVDLWVTAARRASAQLADARMIAPERISTIHYGIEAPRSREIDPSLRRRLGFDAEAPGLAVVANLEPRKGLLVLIRALSELRERGIRLPTVIVGEGPMRAQLTAEITRTKLDEEVRLLGWRDDVAQILAAADLLALPSLANECLPYVILEAMSQGLPVVSTDVAGIPEMVEDSVTGRVVAPGDASALADALAEVAADPEQSRRMGELARVRVQERFAVDTMIDRMVAALALG